MDYFYRRNPLNFMVDSIQSGQMAAFIDLCFSILYRCLADECLLALAEVCTVLNACRLQFQSLLIFTFLVHFS